MITHTEYSIVLSLWDFVFSSLVRDWLGSVSSEFTVKQDSEFLIVHPGFRYWILTITVLPSYHLFVVGVISCDSARLGPETVTIQCFIFGCRLLLRGALGPESQLQLRCACGYYKHFYLGLRPRLCCVHSKAIGLGGDDVAWRCRVSQQSLVIWSLTGITW